MKEIIDPDGHITLSDSASPVPMPDRFGPTGDARVVPQPFGHRVEGEQEQPGK